MTARAASIGNPIPKGKENITNKLDKIFSIFTAAMKLSKSADKDHQIVGRYIQD